MSLSVISRLCGTRPGQHNVQAWVLSLDSNSLSLDPTRVFREPGGDLVMVSESVNGGTDTCSSEASFVAGYCGVCGVPSDAFDTVGFVCNCEL